jgi:hypothetical protein
MMPSTGNAASARKPEEPTSGSSLQSSERNTVTSVRTRVQLGVHQARIVSVKI